MHSYDTRKATVFVEVLFDRIESTREFWCRFLLCVNIIENLTNRHPFKLSKISKRSCIPRTIQNQKATKIFLAQRFRVSTVRLGGEGKQVFELRIFATNLWHLRI